VELCSPTVLLSSARPIPSRWRAILEDRERAAERLHADALAVFGVGVDVLLR
jgi:hypothetical protein